MLFRRPAKSIARAVGAARLALYGARRTPEEMSEMKSVRTLFVAICATLASPATHAQSVADFFKGKTVTVLIGVSAGGEYDLQARLVARYIGRHIPGNPTVVAQNMLGAGGLTEANYLYNVAPKDGTFFGMIQNALPVMQAVGLPGPQFDSAKFNWIGSIAPTVETLAVWSSSGVKTVDDARKKEIVIGAVGKGGITDTFPRMMNEFAGTKFKIVVGYPGGNDVNLAMERGEVAGRNNTWSSWKVTKRKWLDEKLITILAYEGPKPADLQGVPSVQELASKPEDRLAIKLIAAGTLYGRPLALPPGVPADRVAAIREAFMATMKDPDFLKEAAAGDIEVDPVPGETMQRVSAELIATPKAVKDRARPLIQ
jgi:tripartite-type tricarboxylate transporter receptor subunit TctC